ncbi:hypothetical protein PMAYCL1PPCAC_27788, partial [Pristionchus mayeri]
LFELVAKVVWSSAFFGAAAHYSTISGQQALIFAEFKETGTMPKHDSYKDVATGLWAITVLLLINSLVLAVLIHFQFVVRKEAQAVAKEG